MARAVWLFLAAITLVVHIVAVADQLRQPLPTCTQVDFECNPIYLSAEDLEQVEDTALQPAAVEALVFAFNLVLGLGYIIVALFIFWRKSDDWMAMLLSLTLLTVGGALFSPSGYIFYATRPDWQTVVDLLVGLSLALFFLSLYLFPDGRFVPRWTVFFIVLFTVLYIPLGLGYRFNPEARAWLLLMSLNLAAGIFAPIYRYIRVSGPVERQQSKWVAFGFFGALTVIFTWIVVAAFFPATEPRLGRTYFLLFAFPFVAVIGSLFPVCVAIAILRFRLWDIDVIINRTLVYGLLTAVLAAIYFVSVVIMQQLLRGLAGQESPLAVVIATLLIAALFAPLRRRVQDFIDRRFYRSKYDAEKTLARFALSVRDEVDLDELTAALLRAVEETMQPEGVALWLAEKRVRSTE